MRTEPLCYEDMTLDEAAHIAATRGIILVPCATTEGHGNHLPLSTDTLIAEYICGELSKRTGLPTLSHTPIRMGCSPAFHWDIHGNPIAGTLAIRHMTMQNLISDMCRGLWAIGFRKIIMVQCHGQEWNFQTIAHEVSLELRREGINLFIVGSTYWELCRKEIEENITEPFWHADEWETSAILHIRPDLVKMEKAEGLNRTVHFDKSIMKRSVCMDESDAFAVQDVASWVNIPQPMELHAGGVGTIEGIRSATAEKGRVCLEAAINNYLKLLRDLEQYYAPGEVPGIDVTDRAPEPRFRVEY